MPNAFIGLGVGGWMVSSQ